MHVKLAKAYNQLQVKQEKIINFCSGRAPRGMPICHQYRIFMSMWENVSSIPKKGRGLTIKYSVRSVIFLYETTCRREAILRELKKDNKTFSFLLHIHKTQTQDH